MLQWFHSTLWIKTCKFLEIFTPQWIYSIFISNLVITIRLYFSKSQVFIRVFSVGPLQACFNKEKPRCHWLSVYCFSEFDHPLSNKRRSRPWIDHLTQGKSSKRGGKKKIYLLFKENLSKSRSGSHWSLKKEFQAAAWQVFNRLYIIGLTIFFPLSHPYL